MVKTSFPYSIARYESELRKGAIAKLDRINFGEKVSHVDRQRNIENEM